MPSTPQVVPVVTLFDYLTANGTALPNARVSVVLNSTKPATAISPLVTLTQTQWFTTTDPNGYWQFLLPSNTNISPANTTYTVSTPDGSYDVTLGAVGPYQSTALGTIVNVPVPLSPATSGPVTVTGALTVTGLTSDNGGLVVAGGTGATLNASGDLAARSLTVASGSGPYVSVAKSGSIMDEFWLPPPTGGDDSANINTVITTAQTGTIPAVIRAMPGQTYLVQSAAVQFTGTKEMVFDFRGATLKLSASPTFSITGADTNNSFVSYPVIWVNGATDLKLLGGTIDCTAYSASTTGMGVVIGTKSARIYHDGIRVLGNSAGGTLWPFWTPTNYALVTGAAPTDIIYYNCRAAGSGNQGGLPDGGGFKCESSNVRYDECIVESAIGPFGWDLGPTTSITNVELQNCQAFMPVTAGTIGVFLEDTGHVEVRIIGGYYQAQTYGIQIYASSQRVTVMGVHLAAKTVGTGTGILVNQGTTTGGQIKLIGNTAQNFSNGFDVACVLGSGGGNVTGVVVADNVAQTCTNGFLLFNNAAAPSTLSNIAITNNDLSNNTTPYTFTGVTSNGGGSGISFVNNIGTTPDVIFGQAASRIVPGATSLSLRNNANSADNLILTDAGLGTMRNNLTVNGVVASSVSGVAAVWDDAGATQGHQWKHSNTTELAALTTAGVLQLLTATGGVDLLGAGTLTLGGSQATLVTTTPSASFGKDIRRSRQSVTLAGGTVVIDPTAGEQCLCGLSASTTLGAPSPASPGQELHLRIAHDATGNAYTITWNAVFKRAGGAFANTNSANAIDSISFRYDGGLTQWIEIGRAINCS